MPASLNKRSCSSGLRNVFCMLCCSSNPIIDVPFTLRPVPSLCCPSGSIFLAMYFPILRVFLLNTQSSLAFIISSGGILATLNFSSALQYFNFSTNFVALLGFDFLGFLFAFALAITKSKADSSCSIAVRNNLTSDFLKCP